MAAILLASASKARLAMLQSAGLDVTPAPAPIDETAVKQAMRDDGAPAAAVAEALADLKARRAVMRHGDALIVAADQMLVLPGEPTGKDPASETWFDKPTDRAAARAQLQSLRGRRHELISAVVVYRGGTRAWHRVDRARLTVRAFSDTFLDAYLDSVGDDVLHSVGGYQLEGRGAQLFDRVEGDFFTVLGLPLLPLLGYLRQSGVLAA